jgi:tRNA A37 methylthiotransferase MiaB
MKKSSSWTVDQIGEAHKQEVSKSVTTVLERETKLDPKAIEMMTQAVQSNKTLTRTYLKIAEGCRSAISVE